MRELGRDDHALCFKHVCIDGKWPRRRHISEYPPSFVPLPFVRAGLLVKLKPASRLTLHLIESTPARIVRGEHDFPIKNPGIVQHIACQKFWRAHGFKCRR
jgi:hypothetical protein